MEQRDWNDRIDWPTRRQRKMQIDSEHDDTIVTYLDSIRLAESKNLAILLLKNIDSYPSLLDIQSGFIDIWWIIHDGGLLFLLAFLLQQHRVWNKCVLRLFTICLPSEEPQLRQRELEQYVYHLRIQAEVHLVVVADQEISAFIKYRTINVVQSKPLTPFHARESTIEFSHAHDLFSNYPASKVIQFSVQLISICFSLNSIRDGGDKIHYTFTPTKRMGHKLVEDFQIRNQMHSAVRLNQMICEKSGDAQLVLINLPKVPRTTINADYAYIEFVDQLCQGIYRCILVKGGGQEVITIFS